MKTLHWLAAWVRGWMGPRVMDAESYHRQLVNRILGIFRKHPEIEAECAALVSKFNGDGSIEIGGTTYRWCPQWLREVFARVDSLTRRNRRWWFYSCDDYVIVCAGRRGDIVSWDGERWVEVEQ